MGESSEVDQKNMARRAVLQGMAGLGLTVLGGSALSGCGETGPKEDHPAITHGVVPIGRPADFPAGTVSNRLMGTYGIAISNDAGTITAIRPVCTHKGCTAGWDWTKNLFICPCHGSHFDIQGQPVKGPATKNMARLTVIANADGTLAVDLDRLYALVPVKPKA